MDIGNKKWKTACFKRLLYIVMNTNNKVLGSLLMLLITFEINKELLEMKKVVLKENWKIHLNLLLTFKIILLKLQIEQIKIKKIK